VSIEEDSADLRGVNQNGHQASPAEILNWGFTDRGSTAGT